jgi:hypothetical protein
MNGNFKLSILDQNPHMPPAADVASPWILVLADADDAGVATTFEALALLDECSSLPGFAAVVACRDAERAGRLRRLADLYPRLRAMAAARRLELRGGGAAAGLAAAGGRPRVTVVTEWSPATAENARLAMLQGSPLAAPAGAGAVDTFVPGTTGTSFPPGDAACLAAVLSGYLRNAAGAELLGEKASRIQRLRSTQGTGGAADGTAERWSRLMRFDAPERRLQAVERLLGEPVSGMRPIEVGKHSAFQVRTRRDQYFVKFFLDRASDVSLVIWNGFESRRPAHVAWRRTLFNDGNPVAPRVVAAADGPDEPVLATEWLPPYPPLHPREADATVAAIAASCRSFRPVRDPGLLLEYDTLLSGLERRAGLEEIAEFDEFSARLNAPVNGGLRAFARVHPQVELLRLRMLLEAGAWPVPDAFSLGARGVLERVLDRPLSRPAPTLAQTDPQVKHYLSRDGSPILCDFEHSLYAVGPLDEGFWVAWTCLDAEPSASGAGAVDRLGRMLPDDEMFHLGCCWTLAEVLYQALTGFVLGAPESLAKALDFLPRFAAGWVGR